MGKIKNKPKKIRADYAFNKELDEMYKILAAELVLNSSLVTVSVFIF